MADFPYDLLKGVPFIAATVRSGHAFFRGHFIIDTGACMTIIRTPRIDALGYSARDATTSFSTESIIGREEGYCLKVRGFKVFDRVFDDFEVAALDLPPRYNIDGLIGMNLLNQFDWCLFPGQQIISIRDKKTTST